MPDLIAHVGIAYAGSLVIRRFVPRLDPRLAILAAVVPDLPAVVYKAAWVVGRYHESMFPLLDPLKAPVVLLLLAAAVAILFARPGVAFAALAFGALSHVALDLVEVDYVGELLLYPWRLEGTSLGLWKAGSRASLAFTVASLPFFLLACTRVGEPFRVAFRPRAITLALLGLVAAASLMSSTMTRYYTENVGGLAFYDDPTPWEGREVRLAMDLNDAHDPYLAAGIRLLTDEPLRRGARVMVRGVVRGRAIEVKELHRQPKDFKNGASMLAAFGVFIIGLRGLRAPRLGRERRARCDRRGNGAAS